MKRARRLAADRFFRPFQSYPPTFLHPSRSSSFNKYRSSPFFSHGNVLVSGGNEGRTRSAVRAAKSSTSLSPPLFSSIQLSTRLLRAVRPLLFSITNGNLSFPLHHRFIDVTLKYISQKHKKTYLCFCIFLGKL